MNDSFLHLGACPVCGSGLCRVRICGAESNTHPIVLCDECDAYWTTPDITLPPSFLDAEDGSIKEFGVSAWGKGGHWGSNEEIDQLGWRWALSNQDPPNLFLGGSEIETEVTLEAPPKPIDTQLSEPPCNLSDASYGQDEPKPGC